jgi:hypothetical protein
VRGEGEKVGRLSISNAQREVDHGIQWTSHSGQRPTDNPTHIRQLTRHDTPIPGRVNGLIVSAVRL